VSIGRTDAARAVAVAFVFPLVMIVLAPAIGFAIHRGGAASEGHPSLLAEPVERLWRETTDQPLKLFASTDIFTYGVPFYLSSHPIAAHVLERAATPHEEARIAKDGVALLCPMSAPACVAAANARAARSAAGKRSEIEVSHHYLGNEGRSARYLVIAIAPTAPGTQ
jgi:hypothetical protein